MAREGRGEPEATWAWSKHAALRQTERAVPPQQIAAALTHPTATVPMSDGCMVYSRGAVQVVGDPRNHTILSCWYRWKGRSWNQ